MFDLHVFDGANLSLSRYRTTQQTVNMTLTSLWIRNIHNEKLIKVTLLLPSLYVSHHRRVTNSSVDY